MARSPRKMGFHMVAGLEAMGALGNKAQEWAMNQRLFLVETGRPPMVNSKGERLPYVALLPPKSNEAAVVPTAGLPWPAKTMKSGHSLVPGPEVGETASFR